MDLSLNGSALAILKQINNKFEIITIEFIDNTKVKDRSMKLFNISSKFLLLLYQYNPSVIVKEQGFSRHIKATKAINEVDGVINLGLALYNPDLLLKSISPTTIKKIIAGNGKATKVEVLNGINKYLVDAQQNYKFKTLDCSDAVGVGIAYSIKLRG